MQKRLWLQIDEPHIDEPRIVYYHYKSNQLLFRFFQIPFVLILVLLFFFGFFYFNVVGVRSVRSIEMHEYLSE